MPAVVAMTEPIAIPVAERLSAEFYRHLKEHGSVDLALAEACAGEARCGQVLIPTLFSRLGGRNLFDSGGPLTAGEWEEAISNDHVLTTSGKLAQCWDLRTNKLIEAARQGVSDAIKKKMER
jgi:hypothetical protein